MSNSQSAKNENQVTKVLFLCDFFSSLGGTEYYNSALAKGLKSKGVDVRIYIGEKPRLDHWIKELDSFGLHHKEPNEYHENLEDSYIEERFINEVVDEINAWHPDVIHVHPFKKMARMWLSNPKSNQSIPIVATEWTTPQANASHWFDAESTEIANKVAAYIATADIVREGIKEYLGYRGTIATIPHIVHPALNKAPKTTDNRMSVGSIARLSVEKGLDFLLGAWRNVQQSIPNATLHIYGHGPDKERLETLRDCLGLRQSVIFEGTYPPFTGIDSIASKHTVFVQPSLFESIPTSLIELMLRGRSIVASNVGGIPELINSRTGILTEPGNTDQIATAIIDLLKHPTKAKKLATAAQALATERYNYSDTLNKIYKLYNDIVVT